MSESRFLLEVWIAGRLFVFDSEQWDWDLPVQDRDNSLVVCSREGDDVYYFYGTFVCREREVESFGRKEGS